MKIKQIEYSKLKTNPNGFHNEKVGIIVELDEDDSEFQVFERAKEWVNARLKPLTPRPTEYEVKHAQEILQQDGDADNKPDDPF